MQTWEPYFSRFDTSPYCTSCRAKCAQPGSTACKQMCGPFCDPQLTDVDWDDDGILSLIRYHIVRASGLIEIVSGSLDF